MYILISSPDDKGWCAPVLCGIAENVNEHDIPHLKHAVVLGDCASFFFSCKNSVRIFAEADGLLIYSLSSFKDGLARAADRRVFPMSAKVCLEYSDPELLEKIRVILQGVGEVTAIQARHRLYRAIIVTAGAVICLLCFLASSLSRLFH